MSKARGRRPKPEPTIGTLRGAFQIILQSRIKTYAEMEKLASDIGVSLSMVKKMIYSGEGGLDVWGAAFQKLFGWDEDFFSNLKNDIRKRTPLSEADRVWFSIQKDHGTSDEDMHYLALCAYDAARIKRSIEVAKKKKQK